MQRDGRGTFWAIWTLWVLAILLGWTFHSVAFGAQAESPPTSQEEASPPVEGPDPIVGQALDPAQQDDGEDAGEDAESATDERNARVLKRFSMNYFGLFRGPGVQSSGPFQPAPGGGIDRNRPVHLKNYVALNYQASPQVAMSGVGYWTWQPSATDHNLALQDPYLRVSHNALVDTESINWYADLRVHFGVSEISRASDMLGSAQTFNALTWVPGQGTVIASLYASARYNLFGKQGSGSDLELYFAPYLQYNMSSSFAVTLMYELGASHTFGASAFSLVSDGTDLEPGLLWQITPTLAFNPYLSLYPADMLSLRSASIGATLSWNFL